MSNENLEKLSAEYLALSPLDGRYFKIAKQFSPYFSEYALAKNKVNVEVEWLIYLIENLKEAEILKKYVNQKKEIKQIFSDFSEKDFKEMKEIEAIINHDTKSAELFVSNKLKENGFEELMSFVHFGCTSEDISNSAYAKMILSGLSKVYIPKAEELINTLQKLSLKYAEKPMLAHTHGQPATPTTVGKELEIFAYRLKESLKVLKQIEPCAKFSGATGNYSAISVAFPKENWIERTEEFVNKYLKLKYSPVCTQIETHDYVCRIVDEIRHFNNILLDLDRDMWTYISMDYFKLKVVKKEVGSSTMPHKVNPIKFENSEGNIKISNAICVSLSDNLPCSRMQRDLSDSTIQRNIGVAFGHSLLAIDSTISGLNRVEVNEEKLEKDLENNWEVLAEPIQTVLRKYGIPDAYDKLKELTRGKRIDKEAIQSFIKSLDIEDEDKSRLLNLTPATYIGLASQIVKKYIQEQC